MKTVLFWFRRDLRLSDNPALRAALNAADRVVPVYIHSPHEEGDWGPGGASRWWLMKSLARLDRRLRDHDSRLIIRQGDALDCLHSLLASTAAEAVFWNRLYEPAVVERDRKIKEWLKQQGYHAESHNGALLVEPWELRTGKGEPYRVFTPFWRALSKRDEPDSPLQKPRTLRPTAQWPSSLALDELKLLSGIGWEDKLETHWQPGEAGAGDAMDRFLDQALVDYKTARDLPDVSGTSRLSPHLHFGEISPRQAWHRVRSRMAGQAAVEEGGWTWLRELGWREFAHHVLFEFPHTPDQPLYSRWQDFPWRKNHEAFVLAWQRGETGYPIVDAGMRELWETGYMHNRVRMIAASVLVKNIRAPWLSGAKWFWDTLVDADLANNTMGWQWSAGCGADAAPYFRIFNPFTQSRRFDPEGRYLRRWLPELSKLPDRDLHAPHEAADGILHHAGLRLDRDYPRPIVDYKSSREEALAAARAVASA
ncbi:deoxyribodipyrimidine photo-lyase [Gammaproteobacteria bacterium AB-CW1]|uniref:Deoxyribodipyrimidine photo-lyase n=1 Tax=Natronospira elongata TaxID=3110268 RepID=A0AAP6JGM8_9GAMM|nr:deoxyribodipyrimidine photo-lyase [Gammaproteobacteria bacterium AB-CW1]